MDPFVEEQVVLVNEQDEVLGTMGKLEAHEKGVLHRAFSVFIFDQAGRLLLQRRASDKYHSAGLWTNTCCSHPRPGEELGTAGQRRLQEEMGIDCPLTARFHFIYRASFENGLHEFELDHVLFGQHDGPPDPDPREVQEWRYVDLDELSGELNRTPERFTAWLITCWPRVAALREMQRA
ncbi:MAG: isopentenyl-diphosphate Delta-isomerase [Flavobacteriales bacterium]